MKLKHFTHSLLRILQEVFVDGRCVVEVTLKVIVINISLHDNNHWDCALANYAENQFVSKFVVTKCVSLKRVTLGLLLFTQFETIVKEFLEFKFQLFAKLFGVGLVSNNSLALNFSFILPTLTTSVSSTLFKA